jgi:hypothetical protein
MSYLSKKLVFKKLTNFFTIIIFGRGYFLQSRASLVGPFVADALLRIVTDLKIIVRGFMNTNPESKLVWLSRELEDFCFRFCLNHMTAVTQTEAFEHLVHLKKNSVAGG